MKQVSICNAAPRFDKQWLLTALKALPGCVAIPLGKAGTPRAKRPADYGWQKKAYNSERVIDRCIAEKRNIGFRLSDRVFVVDNDLRNWDVPGLDPFLALAADIGIDIDAGAKWQTGGGGYHQPYIIPADHVGKFRKSLSGDELRGLEFRSGRGQMIVAPGSLHQSGALYKVERDIAPVKAPGKLLTLAKRSDAKSDGVGGSTYKVEELERALDSIDPTTYGSHDEWLPLMLASHHATGGEGRDAFVAWSTSDPAFVNDGHMIARRWDSLDPDRNDGVTFKTLNKALRDHGDPSLIPHAATGAADDFPDDLAEDAKRDAVALTAPKPAKPNPFEGVALEAILAAKNPRWLLDGIIVKGHVFELYGREKSGKTFWALHLALCVATNRQCFGRRVSPGRVLYIIAEGNRRLFANRVLAWIEGQAGGDAELAAELRAAIDQNFRVVSVPVYMNQAKFAKAFVEANPGKWSLLVVDTLFRNMDGDVNSSQDMGLFVKGIDMVRRRLNATLMVLHHPGHSTTTRSQGSSAFGAAIDGRAQFYKGKDGKTRLWEVVYLREGVVPEQPTRFVLKDVLLEKGGPFFDFDNPHSDDVGLREPDVTSAYLQLAEAADFDDDDNPGGELTPETELIMRIVREQPETQGALIAQGWSRTRISRVVRELVVAGYLIKGTLTPTKKGRGYAADISDGGDDDFG